MSSNNFNLTNNPNAQIRRNNSMKVKRMLLGLLNRNNPANILKYCLLNTRFNQIFSGFKSRNAVLCL